MTRRSFLRHASLYLKGLLLTGLLPSAVPRAVSAESELHYRPLNGRRLRELAMNKAHHGNGRFRNPIGLERKGRLGKVVSWKLFHGNAYQAQLEEQPKRPVTVSIDAIRRHKGVSVTFLRHASVLITIDDTVLLIDPVFSDIFWFIEDFSPFAFDPVQLPKPDHVLVTHGHYDHLDAASLARLDPKTHVISPLGHDGVFNRVGMQNRTRLDWYDTFTDRGLKVTFLPSNHWTMRNPLRGPNRSLWGGYLIETAAGYTIYLSGDTAYFDGFAEIGRDYPIDLAIINLGAYEPRWFMAQSHMNPKETVRAFRELNAKRLMITHWGTFRLGDEPVHLPPRELDTELTRQGLRDRWVDLRHGDTYFPIG